MNGEEEQTRSLVSRRLAMEEQTGFPVSRSLGMVKKSKLEFPSVEDWV